MSDDDRERVRGFLLKALGDGAPRSTDDLNREASALSRPISPSAVNLVLWYLVGAGELEVTRDNLVVLSKATVAATR